MSIVKLLWQWEFRVDGSYLEESLKTKAGMLLNLGS